MTKNIRGRTEELQKIKNKLRMNQRQSIIELDNILSNVQDKKSFIFLLDSTESEKEITREILEGILENTISVNLDLVSFFEANDHKISDIISRIFDVKNLKNLIMIAIVLGVLISIATNEQLAARFLDSYFSFAKQELQK